MSCWTHIRGTITVCPMGRTQPEKRYVLDTVLEHLPRVTGSEGDMDVYVIQKNGSDVSSSCDEFGMRTDNLTDWNGNKTRRHGWHRVQSQYIVIVDADLRNRSLSYTRTEFIKWICRFAKRVIINDIIVRITEDCSDEKFVIDDSCCRSLHEMFEEPSWTSENEKSTNWCEFMMWDRGNNTDMPLDLCYKYYDDEQDAVEFKRRLQWSREH